MFSNNMAIRTPIPFTTLKEIHVKEPLPEVTPPISQETPIQIDGENVQEINNLQLTDGLPLSELKSTDRLFITRRLRVKNILSFRGKKYRFLVRSHERNLIYTVEEENSWWVAYFCYGLRPMQLQVRNREGDEVMRINRPYACTTRVFPCQLQAVQVFSPPGTRIGSIEQQWTPVRPEYLVKKEDGEQLFWIQGPCITLSCFRDVEFLIKRLDGRAVGSTCKNWEGLAHALFFAPITDRFGVAFENNLSVKEKALLLAASILLDYMYYDI